MSKPESFVRATPLQFAEWALMRQAEDVWANILVEVRDSVVREKDAEFAQERKKCADNAEHLADGWRRAEALQKQETDRVGRWMDTAQQATARAERAEAEVARLTRELESYGEKSRLVGYAEGRRVADEELGRVERRAERAEAQLADAQRAGAWEALTELAKDVKSRMYSIPFAGEVEAFRDTHYAAPEPPSVRLGNGWVVRYDPNTMAAKWQADGKIDGYTGTRFEYELYDLLHAMRYTPTPTEYAALVALAQEAR